MTQSSPVPNPESSQRSPEHQDAVRRRALPVAIGGAICGVSGIATALILPINAFTPPNIVAMNLEFCAMLIGVGILVYAKGTPRTALAAVFSLIALFSGMVGIALYAKQSVDFRGLCESRELGNLQSISGAANTYAHSHEGQYPADLLALLENKLIAPDQLQSPFGTRNPLFDHFADAQKAQTDRAELLKSVETASDYLYLAGDLKSVPDPLAKDILIASSVNTVLRERLAVAFADGHADFVTIDDIAGVMDACNAARKKMGLGDLQPPAIIKDALDQFEQDKKTK